jgi:hypothetical protein
MNIAALPFNVEHMNHLYHLYFDIHQNKCNQISAYPRIQVYNIYI